MIGHFFFFVGGRFTVKLYTNFIVQGNTVLHYAISHGNFDVVSTIMDTGVCNVNLTNDAGYSSVMLVSLAEIKNDEEMTIIKRLFKLGDVNLQAKKVRILFTFARLYGGEK